MSLRRGVELFNARCFFEAHEEWEELWLVATGDEREFLQGLIQLAAAYHHIQRGTTRGAVRLLASSLRHLSARPEIARCVDLRDSRERAEMHRSMLLSATLGTDLEYPSLGYNDALSESC